MKIFKLLLIITLTLALFGCKSLTSPVVSTSEASLENIPEVSESNASETLPELIEPTNHTSDNSASPETSKPVKSEPEPVPEQDGSVILAFGGDVVANGDFGEYIELYGAQYPFKDIKELLDKADISFFNLETAVGTGGETSKPEGFGFLTPPENLDAFEAADYLNCANNHIIDYGYEVFDETISALENHETLDYFGIGNNADEAYSAKFTQRDNMKIGLMGFSLIENYSGWNATDTKKGAALVAEDYSFALEKVEHYAKLCDLLVVSVHWGEEYALFPNAKQSDFARDLIDAGAGMVVGHHPHVLQGIEFYKSAPIFYSAGNFLFYKMDDEAGHTALFFAEFAKTNGKTEFVKGKFIPMNIVNCSVKPASDAIISWETASEEVVSGNLRETIINNMKTRSAGMNCEITDDGEFWRKD